MNGKTGRPTGYTIEIAEAICEALSSTRRSLNAICAEGDMPEVRTVWRWLSKHPEFWDMYTKARDFQTELMYDDMEDIITAPLVDAWGSPLDGPMAMAEVQRRKLAVDTMKFKLAKLQPKRFGENKNIALDVKVSKQLTPGEFAQLLDAAKAIPSIEQPVEDIDHEVID